MSPGSGHDDRKRPDWREIDRRKDRSRHLDEKNTGAPSSALNAPQAKERYKKAATEFLFGGKAIEPPAQKKAREGLHKKFESPDFIPAAEKYLAKYGLPEDWATLNLFLDCPPSNSLLKDVIAAMGKIAAEQSKADLMLFINSLRLIARKTSDTDVRKLAGEIIAQCG